MEKLLPILNDLLIVTANLIIFTRMISWKNPNLRNKIIIYTGCTIIIAAYFLATYFYLSYLLPYRRLVHDFPQPRPFLDFFGM